jgi:hypothetical protein
VPTASCRRHSFCCGREGCRQRVAPPSVRFMGRRVYPAALVTLSCALKRGLTRRRCEELRGLFGASRKTLLRWSRWWKEQFPATKFWSGLRGLFMPPPRNAALPGAFFERVCARDETACPGGRCRHVARGGIALASAASPITEPDKKAIKYREHSHRWRCSDYVGGGKSGATVSRRVEVPSQVRHPSHAQGASVLGCVKRHGFASYSPCSRGCAWLRAAP